VDRNLAKRMPSVNLPRVLTEQHSSLLVGDDYAEFYLNGIKAPNCKELFITVIDGCSNIYVPQQNIYKNVLLKQNAFNGGRIYLAFHQVLRQSLCRKDAASDAQMTKMSTFLYSSFQKSNCSTVFLMIIFLRTKSQNGLSERTLSLRS
jgi:hypothetical protein